MQDGAPDDGTVDPTTAHSGGAATSIDGDNAMGEEISGAGAPEVTEEELRAELEQEVEEANAEIRALQEEFNATTDPEARAQIMDDVRHAQADGVIAQTELDALNNHDFTGSFGDYVENSAGPFGNGSGVFIPMDQQTGQQRLETWRHYHDDYMARASGWDIFEITPLDMIPGGQLRRLGRGRRLVRGASRAQRAAARRRVQERIRGRRRRRNQRRCRRTGSNPVFLDTGAVQQADPLFGVPGLLTVTITSTYQSDIDQRSVLGWGRVSDLDASLERIEKGKLRYRDGAGFHIDFDRPTPIPGVWNVGDHIRVMEIAAGHDRTFMVREEGIVRHFTKCGPGQWHMTAMENRNGVRLEFERDDAGLLTAIDLPEGLRLEMTNDTNRGLRLQVDLLGTDGNRVTVMRYAYDAQDNMVLAECPFGDRHEYAYDDKHRRVWFRKNDQYEAHYKFDSEGRCIAEKTNGPYDGTRFEYDPDLRITRHIPGGDPDRTELIYYQQDGGVFAEAHISGRIIRTYYDDDNNIGATQNGNGHRTHFKYDPMGNVASIEDAEGRISDFRWTEDGQMEFAIDPSGAAWEADYDENGNLIGTTDALGHKTDIKVNEVGQPTGVCRHDGMIRFLSYDENHWLRELIDFDGRQSTYKRDAFGRLIRVLAGENVTHAYEYAPQTGQDFWTPTTVRIGGETVARAEVAKPRRELRQIDGQGRATTYLVDGFGKVEEVRDPKGGTLRFRYDHAEELAEVENQAGQVWRFERDGRGRIVREVDFGGAEITYDYDDADQLIGTTYPDGTVHRLELDKSGLMLKEAVTPPGQDPLVTEYEYDDRGLLAEVRNADATVSFERDENGQVIAETINGTRIENLYDCCGQRVRRQIDGQSVTFSYDPAGRLNGMTVDGHEGLEISHDALGNEASRQSSQGFALMQRFNALGLLVDQRIKSSILVPDGTGEQRRIGLGRSYDWSAALEPTAIKDQLWGDTKYSYDANGQITDAARQDGTIEQFAYDGRMNVNASATQSPALSQAGQIAAQLAGWQRAPDGRVTQARGPDGETIRLTYDPKGRVIERQVLRDGFRPQVWHFEWNGLDRLTTAYTPDGARWTYGYDPFARRLWKQEWTRSTRDGGRDVTQITWIKGRRHDFLWDGDVVAREVVTTADDVTRTVHWIHEPNSFIPLARLEAGQLAYVVCDHLGTPRELVSESGDVRWAAGMRTWGRIDRLWSGRMGSAAGNTASDVMLTAQLDVPIRFQGQWEDAETGLYYNRFRYYDPGSGGYLSPDPIGILGGLQSYGYVRSPVQFSDPFGLQERFPTWMPTRQGYQRHHIIPYSLRNHPALRRLGQSFNINGATNMMYLPVCEGIHPTDRGLHRGWTLEHHDYNQDMNRALNSIERRAQRECWSRRRVQTAVRNLQMSQRAQLGNGSRSLAPPCR